MRHLAKVVLLILIPFLGCNEEVGPSGKNSLLNIIAEIAGPNCPNGGFKIESGIDNNNDGVLNSDEVQNSIYLCNATNGKNSLVRSIIEPPGINCPSGGYKIQSGIDNNGDGILQDNEIQTTQYICNGASEKELRFDFGWPFFGAIYTNSTTGEFNDIKTTIVEFNIDNYLEIDSVAFGAYMLTDNPNIKCFVELYNKTDNTVIVDATVSTNSTSEVFVRTTKNLKNNFPHKKIDLGLRVRSESPEAGVWLKKPILFMYRY